MELQEKLPNFRYYNEDEFYCNTQRLAVSPDAPFDCKLLLIGIVSAKGIFKKVPILQVGGPPTPPVIRVVLLHTKAVDKDLCPDTVCGKTENSTCANDSRVSCMSDEFSGLAQQEYILLLS